MGSSTDPGGPSDLPESSDDRPAYRDADGGFTNERMRNAFYWAAQIDAWMIEGPNAGLEGRYYVEVIGGQPVLVLDESFNEETTKALTDALRDGGFPTDITVRQLDQETRVFVQPNSDWLPMSFDSDWQNYDVTGGFESERGDD